MKRIIVKDGVLGLYRGFRVTALREVAYGPYFLTVSGGFCVLFGIIKNGNVDVSSAKSYGVNV